MKLNELIEELKKAQEFWEHEDVEVVFENTSGLIQNVADVSLYLTGRRVALRSVN